MNYRTHMTAFIAAALFGVVGCSVDHASDASQRQEVRSIVQQATKAQIHRDEATWNALTTADGIWYVQTIDADWQSSLAHQTTQSKISKTSPAHPSTVQHYWNEQIKLDGPIANFWAPYARQVGEEVQECGTISTTLVKTNGTWKIATSTRTRRTFLCQEYRASALKLNSLL